MPVEARTRRLVGESLMRVHGEEVADGLMAMLPSSECATKADLAVLEARMEARFTAVHRSIARQTVAMVIALAGSPIVAAVAERYLPVT